MRGLLSTRDIRTANTPAGLLGIAPPPVNRNTVAPVVPQAAPERRRAGFLSFLLGGTEGRAAEQARLDAEAMRPQIEARQNMLRSIAEGMGPAAILAYELNPEKFGENLAEQYSPQVIAAGGVQSVIGNGQRVSAPRDTEFGTSLVRTDPLSPAPQVLMERGPTPSEQAALINATNPINIAPGGRAVDPRTGETIAEGAPRLQALADGAELFDEAGRPVARNVRDAPPVDPEDARRNADRANAALERIRNTRAAVEQAKEQAGGWTAGAGSVLAAIPGTPAANLAATIDTIQANLSFTELQKMRESSPTGGALGGIAVRELDLLGATVASLSQRQSPEQLQESLKTIEDSLTRWENAVRQAQQQGQQGQARPRARNPQTGEVIEWNGSAWVPAR